MDVELETAIQKIRQAAKDAGKFSAMYCVDGAQGRRYAEMGFNMISVTGDVLALQNYIGHQLEEAKSSKPQDVSKFDSKSQGPYGQ
ncbi:MAG: hypothetical protein Q9159_007301 [Coniocarpon cinnabarinum]